MSEEIVHNPTVPFFTHFHSDMKNGILFTINGTVLPSANRFFVNFQGSTVNTDNIAFHFNVRFDEGIVVWNTRDKNVWGKRGETTKVPFTEGQPFEIQVLVTDQDYKVSVDKNHFLDYPHRIPLERVNTLAVDGAISLQRMEVQPQGIGFHHHYFPGQQKNTVPLASKLPSTIRAGTVVIINGSVPPLVDRFNVNFRTGDVQSDDIAYQFNPRLDEGHVVSNTRRNNNWLQREARSGVPFAREEPFELRFLVTDQSYKVYVNGNYFLDYNHRIPLDQVNTLVIMGCVILNSVEIQAEASGFHHLYFQGEQIQKSVPLRTPFLDGDSDGTVVMINGTVLPSANNFTIDIQCDDKTNNDIAFHFKPRFDKGYVVCNTLRNRVWGKEERKPEVPFTKGQPFETRTLVTIQSYKVSVDRREFLEYNHRIPVELVTSLGVFGGVTMKTVEIQTQGAAFP